MTPKDTNERDIREIVAATARAYIGRNEGDGSHREIIDLYNSHKPLARGYPVKYSDAWCATFVSAVSIKLGLTDIMPTECGCEPMIKLYKLLGSWEENENETPEVGDVIFYDWEDSGSGDDRGAADHVGIVAAVNGGKITVVEGNYSNAVKERTLAVGGRYIRGYGRPAYAAREGEQEMTKEEIKAAVKEAYDELNPIYKDLTDVPECWRPIAASMLELGAINGGTSAEVNATDLNIRKETLKAAIVAVMYHDTKKEV